MISMLLYTWKDVERKLLLNKDKWGTVIVDIETYTDEVIVHLNEEGTEKDADILFAEILDKNYENERATKAKKGSIRYWGNSYRCHRWWLHGL